MADGVFAVEAVVPPAFSAHKINLASFGNMVPHVHWHIIPRWQDDRHFPEPVWGRSIGGPPARPSVTNRNWPGVARPSEGTTNRPIKWIRPSTTCRWKSPDLRSGGGLSGATLWPILVLPSGKADAFPRHLAADTARARCIARTALPNRHAFATRFVERKWLAVTITVPRRWVMKGSYFQQVVGLAQDGQGLCPVCQP